MACLTILFSILIVKVSANYQSNIDVQNGCNWNGHTAFHEEYVTTRFKCATKCTVNQRCVSANIIPEGDRLKCQYFDDFALDLDNLTCGQDGHYYMTKGIEFLIIIRNWVFNCSVL